MPEHSTHRAICELRMRGQVIKEHFVSQVLSSNPLGDPIERDLLVYLPPDYERSLSQRYPVVFALAGYSESDASLQNWLPFQPTLSDRLDLLTAQGLLGAGLIVVMPDCFTAYGGSQYVNSPAVGLMAGCASRMCSRATAGWESNRPEWSMPLRGPPMVCCLQAPLKRGWCCSGGRLMATSCGASSQLLATLRAERPYERLDISGTLGLTNAQQAALRALGAVGAEQVASPPILITPLFIVSRGLSTPILSRLRANTSTGQHQLAAWLVVRLAERVAGSPRRGPSGCARRRGPTR